MDFARRLTRLREAAGLSQEALAASCNRTQGWIGNIERGDGFPRVPEIYKLAKRLSVHPGELFADMPAPSHAAGFDLDRLGVALTAMDKALDDRVIQGRLGKLSEALQFAYLRAVKLNDPADPHQRDLFDDVVREHLRGWDGREGTAEAGTGEDRKVAAQKAPAGAGSEGRKRRNTRSG